MQHRINLSLTLTVIVGAVFCWCSGCQTSPQPTSAQTVSSFSSGVWSTPVVTTTDLDVDNPTDDSDYSTATWDDQSRTAAISTAAIALAAFAHPDLDFQTWFTQLASYLDSSVLDTYRTVDPARIPISSVDTASCVLVDDTTSVFLARVNCGTSNGIWQVLETRTDQNASWLVISFIPPGEW